MDDTLFSTLPRTAADERLEAQLLAAISELHLPALRFLGVEVRSGMAALRGRVPTHHQRQLANLACRRLVGVDRLIDRMRVEPSPGNLDQAAVVPVEPDRSAWRRFQGHTLVLPLLVAAAALVATGCSDGSRLPVVKVKGSLTYEDKPVPGALVVLHPSAAAETAAVRPLGHVAADGSFELSTYDQYDGAPVGEYLVTVEWRTPRKVGGEYLPGPNRLPSRYSRPETSPLRLQIAEDAATLPALRLSRR